MNTRKKPYFAGNTIPLVPGANGILYSRYTDPSQIVLKSPNSETSPKIDTSTKKKEKKRKSEPTKADNDDGEKPAQPSTSLPTDNDHAASPSQQQKERKKPRWSEDKKDSARKEREASGIASTPKVSSKKKKDESIVLKKLTAEDRISGPGNADEALKMREMLGLAVPAEKKVEEPTDGDGFSFGFAARDDGNVAPKMEGGEEIKEGNTVTASLLDKNNTNTSPPESSNDDSSSDDNDSSSSDSSSSSSGSDNSSSDDDNALPPKTTTTTTHQQTTRAAATPVNVDADTEFVPRRVYVGGMPYGYSEEAIKEYWEYCGAIESMDPLIFPDTGRFRGIVFITFATEEGYIAALGCDGERCDGQTLKVQKCKWSAKDKKGVGAGNMSSQLNANVQQQEQQQQQQNTAVPYTYQDGNTAVAASSPGQTHVSLPSKQGLRGPAPKTAGYNVAYVGNVAWEADEDAVKALFEPYGVTKVRLHTDKDTGKPKGYAHVHFVDEESLDKAMYLDGASLMGRKIRMGYAQPKKTE